MSVRPIRLFGDPVLRTPAAPVVDFDKELRTLVADLTDTMLDAPGAGLAAPQIGVGLRVFTWHVDGELGHMVNPALTLSDETAGRPGGLPVDPGLQHRLPARAVAWSPTASTCTASRCVVEGTDDAGPRDPARDRPPRRRSSSSTGSTGTHARRRCATSARPTGSATAAAGQGQPARDQRPGPVRRSGALLVRVVFAGTPEVGPARARRGRRQSRHELVGVLTRPDAPAGRGRRLARLPGGRAWPSELGVPVLKPGAPARPRLPGRAARAWRPTAARWSPTAPCCRSRRSTSPSTAG